LFISLINLANYHHSNACRRRPIAYKSDYFRRHAGFIIGGSAAFIIGIYLQKRFMTDRYVEENRKFTIELFGYYDENIPDKERHKNSK